MVERGVETPMEVGVGTLMEVEVGTVTEMEMEMEMEVKVEVEVQVEVQMEVKVEVEVEVRVEMGTPTEVQAEVEVQVEVEVKTEMGTPTERQAQAEVEMQVEVEMGTPTEGQAEVHQTMLRDHPLLQLLLPRTLSTSMATPQHLWLPMDESDLRTRLRIRRAPSQDQPHRMFLDHWEPPSKACQVQLRKDHSGYHCRVQLARSFKASQERPSKLYRPLSSQSFKGLQTPSQIRPLLTRLMDFRRRYSLPRLLRPVQHSQSTRTTFVLHHFRRISRTAALPALNVSRPSFATQPATFL